MLAQALARLLIEDRDRCGDRETGGRADRGSRPCSQLNDAVPKSDPRTRNSLSLGQALAYEPDDFRTLGELAVMKRIAGPELGEVDNCDVGPLDLRSKRLLSRIDRAQACGAAPHPPGHGQCPIVLRHE